MALRDQPYLPLYVQDFLTDEKLIECSPAATGIYIRLMCIMHKSEKYGTILLKQKDKQSSGKTDGKVAGSIENFAVKLTKFLPWTYDEILIGLNELITEDVLQIKDDELLQKRMVRDNEISIIRSLAGSKGGFAKANNLAKSVAKSLANTESENINENEINNNHTVEDKKKESTIKERTKIYLPLARSLYRIIKSTKNINHSAKQINAWANEIRMLSEDNGVSFDRIEIVLHWYEKNIEGQYTPKIESGRSLRDKFIKLEDAIQRDKIKRNNTHLTTNRQSSNRTGNLISIPDLRDHDEEIRVNNT